MNRYDRNEIMIINDRFEKVDTFILIYGYLTSVIYSLHLRMFFFTLQYYVIIFNYL